MTIGALAKAAGVGVETVRYYQRRGLLEEPRRPARGVRRYAAADAARLRFIRRAQEIGFTLEEVKTLLRLEQAPSCRGARELAATKLAAVQSRLRDLRRMRDALAGLIRQCDTQGDRACPIIASLGRAATVAAKAPG
jgi:MerR family mercuric resistance operon transcriptional regulator